MQQIGVECTYTCFQQRVLPIFFLLSRYVSTGRYVDNTDQHYFGAESGL